MSLTPQYYRRTLLKIDSWYVRAPTVAEVKEADPRVRACFQYGCPLFKFVYPGVLSMAFRASALATGCSVEISGMQPPMHDLRQNKALGLHPILQILSPITDGCSCSFCWVCVGVAETFARVYRSKTGPVDYEWGISSASTDFVRCLPKMVSLPTEAFDFRAT